MNETKDQGPFSLERYDDSDAKSVGLPSPEGLNLLVKFCDRMVGTPFLPKSLAGGPNPAGNILAVVLTGREKGFTPMQSLRAFWLSPDGRLGEYADAMMAEMRKAGFKFPKMEFTDTRAELTAVRPDGDTYTSIFTIEDANRAGLTSKDIWRKYPQRMLKARVIGDVYRFLAADLGGFQVYTTEELQDIDGDSTTAEPTEADNAKASKIAEEFKAVPKTVDLSAVQVGDRYSPMTIAVPVADSSTNVATASKPEYRVYLRTPNGNVLVDEPAHPNKDVAVLRAQALANEHNQEYEVVGDTETVTVNPPKKAATAQPPQATESTGVREQVKARMAAIAAALKLPGTTASKQITAFVAGYLGVPIKQVPKDAALWSDPLSEMEWYVKNAPDALKQPEAFGTALAERKADVTAYVAKMWPNNPQIQEWAWSLFRTYGYESSQDFDVYVRHIGADFLANADVVAWLRLAHATRNSGALVQAVREHNQKNANNAVSLAYMLAEMERIAFSGNPLESVKALEADTAIKDAIETLRKYSKGSKVAGPATPPPAPVEQAKEEEYGGDEFLFPELE